MIRTAILLAALTGFPAMAQEVRYIEPAPVNFERPFLYDGVRVAPTPEGRGEPIPIEAWLANGRTIEGLRTRPEPAPTMKLDSEALQELFKGVLPRLEDTPPEVLQAPR